MGWGGGTATPASAMDYVQSTSSSGPDLSARPRFFFSFFLFSVGGVDPWRGAGGRAVFQRRGSGQSPFIRINQRGDKISPVTEQGYEIRALIEFSTPGRECGASKYHWV